MRAAPIRRQAQRGADRDASEIRVAPGVPQAGEMLERRRDAGRTCSPAANAQASRATSDSVAPKARLPRSSAGARRRRPARDSTVIPALRSARPVAAPSERGLAIDAAAELGGAHGSRLTSPPSWSTAISGGGLPPCAAADRMRRVRARSCAGERCSQRTARRPRDGRFAAGAAARRWAPSLQTRSRPSARRPARAASSAGRPSVRRPGLRAAERTPRARPQASWTEGTDQSELD